LCIFFRIFLKYWGPPSQTFDDAFGSIWVALHDEEEEVIEDHKIKETPYNSMKIRSLEQSIDEESSYGPLEEQ
jgi:hypothetical protein